MLGPWFLLSLVNCVLWFGQGAGFMCQARTGADVDWFIVYKFPLNINVNVRTEGSQYITMDSSNKMWVKPDINIWAYGSPTTDTVSQLYQENREDIMYLMYNDYEAGRFGHTKAERLLITKPNVYKHWVPEPFIKDVPAAAYMLLLATNTAWPADPDVQIWAFHSVGRMGFVSYAKSAAYKKDLYANFLADKLQDNIYVQTWPNGQGGRLKTDCSGTYKTFNIANLDFEVGGEHHFFSSTTDHSKWAVTERKFWFCIGDINRHTSQAIRGGGVVCFYEEDVATAFQNVAKALGAFESCPSTNKMALLLKAALQVLPIGGV